MADVFISYKREERQAVERLAQELRRLGLEVWFDASLNAGETFSDEIDREARAARVILVCWSPAARTSDWVKAEALIGFTNKKLAACYAAGPDGFDPPAPFNSIHAEDLRAWLTAPSYAHSGWKSLLRRIGKLSGREDIESYGALDVQAPVSVLRAWVERHESSPLFMAVDELLRVRDAEEVERARLEQEARERRARWEAERTTREEDAARQAREEHERRQRAEREERARLEQAALAAQNAAAGRRLRGTPWWLFIVIGVVVAFIIWVMLNAGQDQGPIEEPLVQQAEVQEPLAQASTPLGRARSNDSIPRDSVLGAVTNGDVQAQDTYGCGSSLWRQDDRNETQIFQDNMRVALIRLDGTLIRLSRSPPLNGPFMGDFGPRAYVDPTGLVRAEVRLTQGAALGYEAHSVTGTLSVTQDDGRAIVPVAGVEGC